MLSRLKALLSGQKLPEKLSKEEEKAILKQGNAKQRLQLASSPRTRPEVLYYLADDKGADVRKQIAANSSTPLHAADLLVHDKNDGVREELARKIARLMPDLDEKSQAGLRDRAIDVLEKLAQDQVPKIRALIAEELKESTRVPKSLISRLARDMEDIVCGPVLEYSPLLGEEDLREIIAAEVSSAALTAIARRQTLTEQTSQDLVDTLDIPAVSALLTNPNAAIREDTLDKIIDQARGVEVLHKPLALRPQLSFRAMKRIAGFVASALVTAMTEQSDLNPEDAENLLDTVRERLSQERVGDDEEAKLAQNAQDLFDRGILTDRFILDTHQKNSREFVLQCLAVMANLPISVVRKIIHSKSGRAVTALCWQAGLSMRTAFTLQTELALVPTTQLLPGKNGDEYPLKDSELEWHLSYFLDQEHL